MVHVEIIESLFDEIEKKFKKGASEIYDLIRTLEKNPNKGKIVGRVGGIVIKELKYEGFRFYFIVDDYKLKVFSKEELVNLLIKFVRMSDKKSQQKTINEIKIVLQKIGSEGF